MLREVEILSHAIPHKDLCIQWDICTEMIIWDGQMPDRYPNVGLSHPEIMARVKRLSAKVPKDVELGFHLCYGDLDGKHFVDPRDAEKMVDLANALAKTVAHPISYVHTQGRLLSVINQHKGKDIRLASALRIFVAQHYRGEP